LAVGKIQQVFVQQQTASSWPDAKQHQQLDSIILLHLQESLHLVQESLHMVPDRPLLNSHKGTPFQRFVGPAAVHRRAHASTNTLIEGTPNSMALVNR
jgi:hypothetical protein